MRIEQIKKQHKNQWILIEVSKEDAVSQPLEGEILKYGSSRDAIYDALLKTPEGSRVAVLFTGKPLKEGYAAAFFVICADEN